MINVQRLEMELIHIPHTSDNDKKARDNNAKRAQKNEQEQKNIEQGKRAYSKRLITFDSIVHRQYCWCTFFTVYREKTLKIHFMFTSIFYNSDNIFG